SLLISILLPALGKARERAMATRCQSNLHQNGVAHYAYFNDNKHILPLNGLSKTWSEYLYNGQYISSDQSFQCPTLRPAPVYSKYTTYGTLSRGGPDHIDLISGSFDAEPVEKILLADSVQNPLSGSNAIQTYLIYGVNSPTDGVYAIYAHHAKAANLLMGDGHVRTGNKEELNSLPLAMHSRTDGQLRYFTVSEK
ncbi:MAG: H-X9-DG-CTERM domain-containing protein, partial [Phycisphaeraceae bacterium JB051]